MPRCEARKVDGKRCSKTVAIGVRFCACHVSKNPIEELIVDPKDPIEDLFEDPIEVPKEPVVDSKDPIDDLFEDPIEVPIKDPVDDSLVSLQVLVDRLTVERDALIVRCNDLQAVVTEQGGVIFDLESKLSKASKVSKEPKDPKVPRRAKTPNFEYLAKFVLYHRRKADLGTERPWRLVKEMTDAEFALLDPVAKDDLIAEARVKYSKA